MRQIGAPKMRCNIVMLPNRKATWDYNAMIWIVNAVRSNQMRLLKSVKTFVFLKVGNRLKKDADTESYVKFRN